MTRFQARRAQPCGCTVCRADRLVRDVALGIGIGLAAVGAIVGAWAWMVVLSAVAGGGG